MSTDPNHSAVSALLRPRYRVVRRLPWSGLALVYLAERRDAAPGTTGVGRRVAVALLPIDCEVAPELEAPFLREAARLRAIDDPHVVPITDAGVLGGVPFLEMRYESAPTLAEVLASPAGASASHFGEDRAVEVARQLLRGLAGLHAHGVCHWDLTPSNVLLAIDTHGWEQVRIVGAGVGALVRGAAEAATAGRARRGSGPLAHRYLPPEIREGDAADRRADLYSVGAVLMHLLAGTLPAEGTDPRDALRAHPALARVVARAMHPEREERYASARGMGSALDDPGGSADDTQSQPTLQLAALRDGHSLAPTSSSRRTSLPPRAGRALRWAGAGGAVLFGMAAALGLVAYTGATQAGRDARGPKGARVPTPAIESRAAAAPVAQPDAQPDAEPAAEPATGTDAQQQAEPIAEDGAPRSPGPVTSDLVFALDEASPPAAAGPDEADPLAADLPPDLAAYHARIEAGERVSREEINHLYGIVARDPDDVRSHLVLGHAFMNLGWRDDALGRYRVAGRLDAARVRGDRRVLPDLMELLRFDDHHEEAALAIRDVFGAEALPLVRAAIETEPRWQIRHRLERLAARIEARTTP